MAVTSTLSALLVFLGCMLSTTQAFSVLSEDDQVPMEDLKFTNYFKLIELAVKDGETAVVELVEDIQMLIAQHGAKIVMDCDPLMLRAGRPVSSRMEWKENRLAPGSDGVLVRDDRPRFFNSMDRIKVTGDKDRYLNITSANVVTREEVDDNGIYTCTVCTDTTDCQSASVVIYMLGTPFEVQKGKESDTFTSNRLADRVYNVGTNFCVEEGSTEKIQLRCNAVAVNSTLPFPIPTPFRTWSKNGSVVYSGVNVNRDFFVGSVLRLNVVSPRPLISLRDGSLLMNFEASRLNFPQRAPGSTAETIQGDVLEAMLGSWTCSLSTDLQSATATTVITKC